MFRHLITEINIKKLIEMQSKQRQTKVAPSKAPSTRGKQFVKKFQRID